MLKLQGKSVYRDVCIGRLVYYGGQRDIGRRAVEDREAELLRFEKALLGAKCQLRDLYQDSVKVVGEANAAIFQVQELLLDEKEYGDCVRDRILQEGVNAEYAVRTTGDEMAGKIGAVEDTYIRERAQDILRSILRRDHRT